jgi:hypothetical protein
MVWEYTKGRDYHYILSISSTKNNELIIMESKYVGLNEKVKIVFSNYDATAKTFTDLDFASPNDDIRS